MTVRRDRSRSTRNRRLKAHPLCAHCRARGLVRKTDIIDHIVPLAFGGADSDENVQGLCFVCEAVKTATESTSAEGVRNHPDWLRPAIAPLTIVCGPPCSGKTTLVAARAHPSDLVIDLDAIVAELRPGWRAWLDPLEPALFNRAIRIRNAALGALSRPPGRRAWFIVGAPSLLERRWWQGKLGGDVLLLDTSMAECIRRAHARGTPVAVDAIARWFDQSRLPWSPDRPRPRRVGCDADGFPLES